MTAANLRYSLPIMEPALKLPELKWAPLVISHNAIGMVSKTNANHPIAHAFNGKFAFIVDKNNEIIDDIIQVKWNQ